MSAFTVHFMCSCQAVAEHFERINRRQGSQGNHYPVTVGEMRRTPRGELYRREIA